VSSATHRIKAQSSATKCSEAQRDATQVERDATGTERKRCTMQWSTTQCNATQRNTMERNGRNAVLWEHDTTAMQGAVTATAKVAIKWRNW